MSVDLSDPVAVLRAAGHLCWRLTHEEEEVDPFTWGQR